MADDRKKPRVEQVYSITSAREGHSDELGAREIRYAVSMLFRSFCFLGGVFAWLYVAVWLGVILMVLAVFLPYTSVILANAGVRKAPEASSFLKPDPYGEIGTGPADQRDRERE